MCKGDVLKEHLSRLVWIPGMGARDVHEDCYQHSQRRTGVKLESSAYRDGVGKPGGPEPRQGVDGPPGNINRVGWGSLGEPIEGEYQ